MVKSSRINIYLILLVSLLLAACSTTKDVPPSNPSNVTIQTQDSQIVISWNNVGGATSYNIYLASEADVNKTNYQNKTAGQKVTDASSPYTVSGLTNGTIYYFVVTALNANGESTESSEVSATPATQGQQFNPTEDTSLPAGDYDFESINIPEGVKVTLEGEVVINVTGDSKIDGDIIADCTKVEIRVQGDFTLDGLITNICTDQTAEPKDLKILADGNLTIGSTISDEEAVTTDGFLEIVDSATENDSLEPVAEFASLAEMLTVTPLASSSDLQVQQRRGRGTVNRLVKGRKGTSIRQFEDLNINVGIKNADDGVEIPAGVGVNCDKSNTIGGTGGSISLGSRNGTLTITGNLTAGDGAKGADCTANNPAGDASAKAGHGGAGGSILVGGVNIVFQGAITLERGNGGTGGIAIAEAGDGPAPCKDGFDATAFGGNGGITGGIGYLYFTPGSIVGAPTEAGGNGGDGGLAKATGGDGQDCNQNNVKAGNGGKATSKGGNGGKGASRQIWAGGPNSGEGGNGGKAISIGGEAGNSIVITPPCTNATAIGGDSGDAEATGGERGRGVNGNGNVGDAEATVKKGGDAIARSKDCNTNDGTKGGDATATGGNSGNATAIGGAASKSTVENGGAAMATGGKGANCVDCPKRDGGPGGRATATGGQGGNASGDGTNTDGNGGDATANGGMGGTGDNGCTLLITGRGGNGGKGGNATANAGTSEGSGRTGKSGGKAGDGGDGNNSIPPNLPGSGGMPGAVAGTPTKPAKGAPGVDGILCPPQQVVTLDVDTSGSGTGSVTVDPPMPAGGYSKGTKVTITAVPSPNSVFDSWSGGASGNNPVVVVTMDGNKSVIAKFVKTYALKVDTEGNGTVNVDPSPNAPNDRYKEGTVVTLTANPAQGSELKEWEGDCAGSTGDTCTLTMDGDKMAKAIFGPLQLGACELLFDNFKTNIFVVQAINAVNINDPSLHLLELFNDPNVEPQVRQLLIQMVISFIVNIANDLVNVDFPQPFVDVEGGFESTQNGSCNIAAMGVGPLFPESNVEAQLDASIDPNTGVMNAIYVLGVNGTIGGEPVTIQFEAQLAPLQ